MRKLAAGAAVAAVIGVAAGAWLLSALDALVATPEWQYWFHVRNTFN